MKTTTRQRIEMFASCGAQSLYHMLRNANQNLRKLQSEISMMRRAIKKLEKTTDESERDPSSGG